jgi:hypothetical protein
VQSIPPANSATNAGAASQRSIPPRLNASNSHALLANDLDTFFIVTYDPAPCHRRASMASTTATQE